jgi:hypothetical protein
MTDWDPADDYGEFMLTPDVYGCKVQVNVSCRYGNREERMWGVPLEKCKTCKHHIRIKDSKVMCRAEQ